MGIKLIRGAVVMVNFMYQFGQSNTILHVSVTMFLDEIYIQNQWPSSKADSSPLCGWTSFNQLKACIEKAEFSQA